MKKLISLFLVFCSIGLIPILAQSVCCPEFELVDAVEICPPEGACSSNSSPVGISDMQLAACKQTAHVYTVYPNDPAYIYTWYISGGTPSVTNGNPVNILWGSGSTGSISVVVTNISGSCRDSLFTDICLIDGPQADFSLSAVTVCVNTPVSFTNLSIGGAVFTWDFGDGSISSLANPPPHFFTSPGTYTITLEAMDNGAGQWVILAGQQTETLVPCGCSDAISKTIVVLPGTAPAIETDCCYGTVCPGDTSSFCTSMLCSSYNWMVTGGTIISGSGSSCITVQWDAVYSVPTTVSLDNCPGSTCPATTTIDVPVLYPDLPINGPSTLCVGASGTYQLPVLPGTYYDWTVSGGPYSFNQKSKNTASVNISFLAPGNYYVKCELNNPLAGCSGVDSMLVQILPVFSISGEDKVCEGDMKTYTAPGPATWSVSPAGPLIVSGNGTATITVLMAAGTYTITAIPLSPSNYCNAQADKIIEVTPLPILYSILGSDTVCPGMYTYSVSSDTYGSDFNWSISSGSGSIVQEMGEFSDSLVVNWTGTGPWQLSVDQSVEISPGIFCTSTSQVINVVPEPLPSISGNNSVCADDVEIYVASGTGNDFTWSISPSNAGTILSGQGSNSVSVQWHGPGSGANLIVTNCAGSTTFGLVVSGPPSVYVSYSQLPVFCLGDNVTLILSTFYSGSYSYQWYKNGVAVSGATGSALALNIASITSAGTYNYHVVVSENGCPVTSNIIKVVVEDCSGSGGGPGPGNCDVVAYFRTYVECDMVTIIDKSYAISPATISSYTYSATGPGSVSFLPSPGNPSPTLIFSASGNYTITLTLLSSSGCTETWTETVNILLPTAAFTYSSPICENTPALFFAFPNNPNYNYLWTFGDGSTSYEATTNHSYASSTLSPYMVNLIITDQYGCTARDSNLVTVNPLPNCSISTIDTIICPGDYTVLNACSGMTSYSWYRDDQLISGAISSAYNAFLPGEYYALVSNSNGCTAKSNTIRIYQHKLPKVDLSGPSQVCSLPSSVVSFYVNTLWNANYSYSWSSLPLGAGFSPSGGNNPLVTVTTPATLPDQYSFYVTVSDGTTGCQNTDSICVTLVEKPQLSLPGINQCEGPAVFLQATPGDTANFSYQWSNGNTMDGIWAWSAGYYALTVTDKQNGCSAQAMAGFINPLPDLRLFPTGCDQLCPPDSLQLYLPLCLNDTWPNNTYSSAYPSIGWYSNGNYGSLLGSGKDFTYLASNSGQQQFSVVVSNSFGCIDTAGFFCLTDECCNLLIEGYSSGNATCPEAANGWFSFTIDPLSTGGPFTLSSIPSVPPLPMSVSAGGLITIPNLAPGVYIFTVSDSSGSCSETMTVDIGFESPDCCFASYDSSFIKITSNITYTSDVVWDNKYYIDDFVTVTVTSGAVLDITNVDVVFGECAGIVFQNGAYLRSNNSVYRPCDIMGTWKGLRFEGPGEFDNIVNECTFKNAEVALYFKDSADAVISNGLFSNCNYGIRVEGNPSFNHPLSGNRFVWDEFYPDYLCTENYSFFNSGSVYGIYFTGSRIDFQLSHNQFLNSRGSNPPSTYGIYLASSGGSMSENIFSDLLSPVHVQNGQTPVKIENNTIECNQQATAIFPAIFVSGSQSSITEINNNQIRNNYNSYVNHSAIYVHSSDYISMLGNQIEGFRYGIVSVNVHDVQITDNQIDMASIVGVYFFEAENSHSFITCNEITMRNYTGSYGIYSTNMASASEVSSNCVTDCATSMYFRSLPFAAGMTLPKIRNNYLYNYTAYGIYSNGCTGSIGTSGIPGQNTLYSNNNSAVDIGSNTSITVADNFGMFSISWPFVQITSNNPYHSTASCGHQIFNLPSQGNFNQEYTCDNYLMGSGLVIAREGEYILNENHQEMIAASVNKASDIERILSSVYAGNFNKLSEFALQYSLNANEINLLKYAYFFRNGDFGDAVRYLNQYTPEDEQGLAFKELRMKELDLISSGFNHPLVPLSAEWTGTDLWLENFSIYLENNSGQYRDYLLDELKVEDIEDAGEVVNVSGNEAKFHLFPNPAGTNLTIDLMNLTDDEVSVCFWDISGKCVLKIPVDMASGRLVIDISRLTAGFYTVGIEGKTTNWKQKEKLIKL